MRTTEREIEAGIDETMEEQRWEEDERRQAL